MSNDFDQYHPRKRAWDIWQALTDQTAQGLVLRMNKFWAIKQVHLRCLPNMETRQSEIYAMYVTPGTKCLVRFCSFQTITSIVYKLTYILLLCKIWDIWKAQQKP